MLALPNDAVHPFGLPVNVINLDVMCQHPHVYNMPAVYPVHSTLGNNANSSLLLTTSTSFTRQART